MEKAVSVTLSASNISMLKHVGRMTACFAIPYLEGMLFGGSAEISPPLKVVIMIAAGALFGICFPTRKSE